MSFQQPMCTFKIQHSLVNDVLCSPHQSCT